jgi:hypothetical protein
LHTSFDNALNFLKNNNPAFADIIINMDRIHYLPIEGELSDIETIDYHPHNDLSSDMHGEILEISCRSITVKSDISGGDGLGSMLLSSGYNFIMFLSIEQRLHTSFDIFIPIRK